MTKKLYLIILVMVCCIGCDQMSKNIASNNLKFSEPIVFLGNLFRLQYAENTGAFLSLGSDLPASVRTFFFTFLSGGLLVGLFLYIFINRSFSQKHVLALSLILGGGCSNLIDRVANDGRVVDFMNLGIGSLRTGIFNMADVAIMVGMAMILLFSIGDRNKTHSEAESTEPPK
ncbi:signal peptidase II [bacterium]|nr:signal peptidase II [bacterium]